MVNNDNDSNVSPNGSPSEQHQQQHQDESKEIVIQSSKLHKKTKRKFTSAEYQKWMKENNIFGLRCVEPQSDDTILDFEKLHEGHVYSKLMPKNVGVADATFTSLTRSVDTVAPAMIDAIHAVAATFEESVFNRSAYKLSACGAEHLDGSIFKMIPDFNVVMDTTLFVSSLYEFHTCLLTFRTEPFAIPNLIVLVGSLLVTFWVMKKRYCFTDLLEPSVSQGLPKAVNNDYAAQTKDFRSGSKSPASYK